MKTQNMSASPLERRLWSRLCYIWFMNNPYVTITDFTTDDEKIDIVLKIFASQNHGSQIFYDKLRIPANKQKDFQSELMKTGLLDIQESGNGNPRMSFVKANPAIYDFFKKFNTYMDFVKSKSDYKQYITKLDTILNYLRKNYKSNGEIIRNEDFTKETGVAINDPAIKYLKQEKRYLDYTSYDIWLTPLGYNDTMDLQSSLLNVFSKATPAEKTQIIINIIGTMIHNETSGPNSPISSGGSALAQTITEAPKKEDNFFDKTIKWAVKKWWAWVIATVITMGVTYWYMYVYPKLPNQSEQKKIK
jgi:hypothetical protein